MYIADKESKKKIFIIICFVVIAWLLRLVSDITSGEFSDILMANIRTYIYFGIFIYWGMTIKRRIIQTSARRKLYIMSVAMVAWLLVRTLKFTLFTEDSVIERLLWYLYYAPMMIVPLMGLLAAMSLGKPEQYKLPKWTYVLHLVTLILVIVIATNDLHQLAFTFKTVPFDSAEYSYNVAYFIAAAYIVLLTVSTYVIILIKGRIPEKKSIIIAPVIFMCATLGHVICYGLRVDFVMTYFGDMTVFFCLMGMCIWESYLQTGMIPVNIKYREFMEESTGIAFQILDSNRQVKFKSNRCYSVSQEDISEAEKHPVILNNNIKLSHSNIRSGHVLWQEDISEIMAINEKLQETKKTLEDETLVVREKYTTSLRRCRLEEQNRLYDKMQRETEKQISSIMKLINRCEEDLSEEELKLCLVIVTILGAYLKRRSNLLIMGDSSEIMKTADLEKCFEESLNNIKIICPECGIKIDLDDEIKVNTAISLYDFFEESIEKVRHDIDGMYIRIYVKEDKTVIRIAIETETELTSVRDEDGTQILSHFVREESDIA